MESREARSTEEVLRMTGEANQRMERDQDKDITVGSMDVLALYPSIDQ